MNSHEAVLAVPVSERCAEHDVERGHVDKCRQMRSGCGRGAPKPATESGRHAQTASVGTDGFDITPGSRKLNHLELGIDHEIGNFIAALDDRSTSFFIIPHGDHSVHTFAHALYVRDEDHLLEAILEPV